MPAGQGIPADLPPSRRLIRKGCPDRRTHSDRENIVKHCSASITSRYGGRFAAFLQHRCGNRADGPRDQYGRSAHAQNTENNDADFFHA